MEEDKWIYYVFISAGMKFRNKKKFLYGIPAHFKDWLCQYFDTAAVKVKACVLRIWTLELVHTKLCDMF
jgi:hypothetical protein